MESCCRRSPWCIPSLVRIGTHFVHFLKSRRQIFSLKTISSSEGKGVNEDFEFFVVSKQASKQINKYDISKQIGKKRSEQQVASY